MSIGRLPSGAILGNGPYCESSTNSGSGTCGRVIELVSLSGMGRGETSGGGGGASSAACWCWVGRGRCPLLVRSCQAGPHRQERPAGAPARAGRSGSIREPRQSALVVGRLGLRQSQAAGPCRHRKSRQTRGFHSVPATLVSRRDEAGNMALRVLATGGVFVGGGIAPKVLPALERGGALPARLPRQGPLRAHRRPARLRGAQPENRAHGTRTTRCSSEARRAGAAPSATGPDPSRATRRRRANHAPRCKSRARALSPRRHPHG